jgi:hypothetical protein
MAYLRKVDSECEISEWYECDMFSCQIPLFFVYVETDLFENPRTSGCASSTDSWLLSIPRCKSQCTAVRSMNVPRSHMLLLAA